MSFYDAIRIGASGASSDLEIQRSLRFNDGDAPKLQRTLGSSGNRRTFTWSGWVKRTHFAHQALFSSTTEVSSGNSHTYLLFNSSHQLVANSYNYSGGTAYNLITTQLFRDPSAWYHIVWAIDTTQSTSSNRVKLYVNGEQITSFSTAVYPSQNYEGLINNSSYKMLMGNAFPSLSNNSPFDGYMAEVNFVDGLQLTPDSFGKTDVVTGQWIPQKYSGAYGTNGFRITFADNSDTTATTLGKDESGNGNNFTPSNFSVAANLTNDSMPDTPSNNFCTFNNINATNSINFGNLDGNLVFDQTSNDQAMTGTFFISPQTGGKWYWEIYKNASQNPEIGICGQQTLTNRSDGIVNRLAFITNGGNLRTGSSSTTSITGGSAQTGAGWIRIACDMDNKKIWFSDTSGNYFNSGNPATGANAAYDFSSHEVADGWTPYVFMGTGGGHNCYVNFGQFDLNNFSSNIPAGFKTLTSENLPDPTILLPNKHFDPFLYSATGNAMSFSGLNFQPDWIWQKRRDNVGSSHFHYLFDAVRGGTQGLQSNTNGAEFTASSPNITFTSNGYDMVASTGGQGNGSGGSYVSWNWNAGETDSATYTVKVVSDSGNKYRFNDFGTSAVTLNLAEGGTYTFDQSDSSMSSHPMKLSTTANGTHGGGSSYNTGVTYQLDGSSVTESAFVSGFSSASSRKLIITVAASAPTLYYYCHYHSGMGGAVNTNSTLGSSNFDGSVQSIVKVNASAGFSIITYTRNGGSITVGHGLGVAPKIYIRKRRDTTDSWIAYNTIVDGSMDYLILNSTDSKYDSGFSAPTSTIFNDDSSGNMVVYAFSPVEGYSKFGRYTGNGSDDGAFVYTGFRPAWVLLKNASTGSTDWVIKTAKISPHNRMDEGLRANTSGAEESLSGTDFLSNGFKIRNNGSFTNTNGNTYIYLAFAESPFKNARAR